MKVVFEKIGTIDAAQSEINKALMSAIHCLETVPESHPRHTLERLVRDVAERDF